MTLYDTYSEEKYYTKRQLLDLHPGIVGECMYEEIWNIRKRFKIEVDINGEKYFVVLTKRVNSLMMSILENKIKVQEMSEDITMFVTTNLISNKQQFYMLCKNLNNDKLGVLSETLYSQQPLLFHLFLICYYNAHSSLLYAYLVHYNRVEWYAILKEIKIINEKNKDLDLTGEFLSFLSTFHLKIYEIMLLSRSDEIKQNYDEIQFRYPQLNEQQIKFYLSHNNDKQYYTIENFKQFSNLSYENARRKMDLLMQLNFYKRIKIGKKYVYTTNGCL